MAGSPPDGRTTAQRQAGRGGGGGQGRSRQQAPSAVGMETSQTALCHIARGSGTSRELQYTHAHWIKSRQTGSQSKH